MGKTQVAKDYAFPGCCGVTTLARIQPTKSKTLIKWIRAQHRDPGLGGLVIAASNKGDRKQAALLRLSGFKVVFKNDSETLWVRRTRGSSNW